MENTNTVENQNQENNTAAATGNGNEQQERTFTQDEVNRIVQDRLARVKADVSPELQERERHVAQKELLLDARERLADAGLPKELLTALNCGSKEEIENSINTIQKVFGQTGSAARSGSTYRICTGSGGSGNGSGHHSGVDDPESIRKAIGLKG